MPRDGLGHERNEGDAFFIAQRLRVRRVTMLVREHEVRQELQVPAVHDVRADVQHADGGTTDSELRGPGDTESKLQTPGGILRRRPPRLERIATAFAIDGASTHVGPVDAAFRWTKHDCGIAWPPVVIAPPQHAVPESHQGLSQRVRVSKHEFDVLAVPR